MNLRDKMMIENDALSSNHSRHEASLCRIQYIMHTGQIDAFHNGLKSQWIRTIKSLRSRAIAFLPAVFVEPTTMVHLNNQPNHKRKWHPNKSCAALPVGGGVSGSAAAPSVAELGSLGARAAKPPAQEHPLLAQTPSGRGPGEQAKSHQTKEAASGQFGQWVQMARSQLLSLATECIDGRVNDHVGDDAWDASD